jgi:tetratricopeptide (TPR) repeat protein
LAERSAPEFVRRDQVLWLDRIDRDNDNLRAVLRRSVENRDVRRGLRLANALYLFRMQRHVGEGRTGLAELLAISDASGVAASRARARSTAGAYAGVQGDFRGARSLLTDGLDLARQVGDRAEVAYALFALAAFDRAEGDLSTTRTRFGESLALWRAVADPWYQARCLYLLVQLAAGVGGPSDSRSKFEGALALLRELGDRWGIAHSVRALGFDAYHRGDDRAAQGYYDESLALAQELGDRALVAWTLWGLGLIACARADYDVARENLAASLVTFRDRQERGRSRTCSGGSPDWRRPRDARSGPSSSPPPRARCDGRSASVCSRSTRPISSGGSSRRDGP